ncbi:MAG TPA: hypothetical protein QF753_22965, partial [Victivallales bacterium]|nr:hypothetical protein [Victivallales bacterium]
ETYTIDTITSDTVLSVIEPIFTTQTTASIKKQSFVPDKINDVILATITENSSGNAWTMEQHCSTPGVQGAQGATGEGGYSVKLEPSSHVVSYTVEGDESDTITFSTTPTGIAGTATYTFQVDGSTASGTTAGQSSGSFTLADGEEPAASDSIIVKVILYDDGVSKASDTVSIYGIKSGEDAITVILTNDSHTIPTDVNGANGTYTGSGTDIKVWRGGTALAYHDSSANTFSIGTPDDTDITVGNASTPSTYVRRYDVASAFTAGTSTKTASISFPITVRDAAGGGTQTFTKIQTFSKSFTGAVGSTGASTNFVFARASSEPSVPTADGLLIPSQDIQWYDAAPSGTDLLWASKGTVAAGGTAYTWGAVFQVEGAAVAEVYIYRKNSSVGASGGSYNFTNNTLTAPSNWETSPQALSANNDAVYVSLGLASGAPTATAASISWSTPVIYAQRTDGQGIKYASLYKLNDSTITTNNFGTFADPTSGAESGWTIAVPDLGTVDGNKIYVTTRTFTSDGASPQTSTWTAPVIHSQYTIGDAGLRTIQGYLYYEKTSAGTPSTSGIGTTYTFSTGVVSGSGITNDPSTATNTWKNSPNAQDAT